MSFYMLLTIAVILTTPVVWFLRFLQLRGGRKLENTTTSLLDTYPYGCCEHSQAVLRNCYFTDNIRAILNYYSGDVYGVTYPPPEPMPFWLMTPEEIKSYYAAKGESDEEDGMTTTPLYRGPDEKVRAIATGKIITWA